jgi:hypothetical protein
MIRPMIVLAGFVAVIGPNTAHATPQVGDVYEITMIRDSSEQSTDGSSSSHDQDAISERVVGLRPDGVELEYDLPKNSTAQDRKNNWQFPARVFKPGRGTVQLLNGPELEARADHWLKEAKIGREACGHWIFTWNAFQIQCDPKSVIDTITAFDVSVPDLRDGAPYQETGTLGPVPLRKKALETDGATFTAELKVDPEAVRRAEAATAVVVGEILRKPVTLEDALRERAKMVAIGTVVVTFNVDAKGAVRRKAKITKTQIQDADGSSISRTATQTIDRTLISGQNHGQSTTQVARR